MIGDEENELVSYDSQSQQIKHCGVHGCSHLVYVVTYIESLVALEGANGLRKADPNSPDTVANMEASRPSRKRVVVGSWDQLQERRNRLQTE
ncbi:unnamed protein product [Camellia sinensis]